MPKIVIRKMRRSDLDAVSELAMLANPHATKEKYCKHILDDLRKNPDLSFVAVENGKVVGYVQADIHNDEAVLEDIAVAKEYQMKGIGKRLLNKELKALKRKGAKIVLAEVHYKCASAIPFYYKHNFRITGFVQDFFGIGHDTIILKLVLQ
ncbi:MAG: GNAT family N-acetyltransferase [Candidatus Bathyarchaeia archaeon]|nr:GNAT family N-acetyltransferase [Candidatus Bathyarchaeia archaeon]